MRRLYGYLSRARESRRVEHVFYQVFDILSRIVRRSKESSMYSTERTLQLACRTECFHSCCGREIPAREQDEKVANCYTLSGLPNPLNGSNRRSRKQRKQSTVDDQATLRQLFICSSDSTFLSSISVSSSLSSPTHTTPRFIVALLIPFTPTSFVPLCDPGAQNKVSLIITQNVNTSLMLRC
jgi:hypothetical protein